MQSRKHPGEIRKQRHFTGRAKERKDEKRRRSELRAAERGFSDLSSDLKKKESPDISIPNKHAMLKIILRNGLSDAEVYRRG
jgi:hypothetical protein